MNKHNVTILGAGYVGLPTAAHWGDLHQVTVYDPNTEKIIQIRDALEGKGTLPVHESGLKEALKKCRSLRFTDSIEVALENPDLIFLAVGTPPKADGKADLSHIKEAAKQISQNIKKDCIVVTKSTVPPGTGYVIEAILKTSPHKIQVASCPEFLAEGSAMQDLNRPSRIVLGCDDKDTLKALENFFSTLHPREKIVTMDLRSAEVTKYFANAMLASRISFMNDAAIFCDAIGANIHAVRKALALDPRIGEKFLYSGFGYGGSCFPKDTRAIAEYANLLGSPLALVSASIDVNKKVLLHFFDKIKTHYGSLQGKKLVLWGIGFKAGTNDVRESQAVFLAEQLKSAGANVIIYDRIKDALANFKKTHEGFILATTQYQEVKDADGIIIGNEDEAFRLPDTTLLLEMREKIIFDGKNTLPTSVIADLQKEGFKYEGVGTKSVVDKLTLQRFLEEKYA